MHHQTQQFELMMTLKLQQLHRQGLQGVTIQDLSRIFTQFIWKQKKPARLSDAVNQILNISMDDIVRYLALDSQIQGKKSSLEDYVYMFKG